MPDIATINTVAAADIATVNGVAKADIATVNAVDMPSGTVSATYWAICFDDATTSWAAHADIADVTEWEDNVWNTYGDASGTDTIDIAYGKDTEGNGIFVALANSSGNNVWVDQTSDITDGSAWTRQQLPSGTRKHRETIQWGNDVWVTVGRVSSGIIDVHRSTDGADNFLAVDITGLTNISSTETIKALASDGAGKWMFGQKANLYFSDDDGATWAWLIQPSGASGDFIRDIVYTNGSWVVLYSAGGNANLIACVGSTAANMDAAGDWGTAVTLTGLFKDGDTQILDSNNNAMTVTLSGTSTKRMAAAGGRIVAMQMGGGNLVSRLAGSRTIAADVSGKIITLDSSGTVQRVPFTQGTAQAIATDGGDTWLAGGDGGDTGPNGGEICRSTDGGDSWTLIAEAISGTSKRVNGIAPDVYLPL
jgi:hypothetical protein